MPKEPLNLSSKKFIATTVLDVAFILAIAALAGILAIAAVTL